MSKYSSSTTNEKSIEAKTKDMKIHQGGNLNINLSLLSNKSSITTLMTMAKKQKNGVIAKKSNENNTNDSTPTINSSIVDQNKNCILSNQRSLITSNSQSDLALLNRTGRSPIMMISSNKSEAKLEVMKKLSHNLESRSTTNIFFNKNQQGQQYKQQQQPSQLTVNINELKKAQASTISTGLKKLFCRNQETIYDKSSYYIKKANCVLEFAYREEQNPSYKEAMEDMGKAIDSFNNNINEGLFCLFDGHGGDSASKYLQEHFTSCFKQALYDSGGNVDQALTLAFSTIDKELEDLEMANVGSTGCVIYTLRENNRLTIYTANVGDTRCSLISPVKYTKLTYDHRADAPDERSRIIDSGGDIIDDRVMGILMLTRAFGDFSLKPYGVKSEPYISKTIIDGNCKNQILVCASDGVWDVVNEEDMQNYIMFNNETEELCKTIIKYAIAKGSWDNLSCFAIKLT